MSYSYQHIHQYDMWYYRTFGFRVWTFLHGDQRYVLLFPYQYNTWTPIIDNCLRQLKYGPLLLHQELELRRIWSGSRILILEKTDTWNSFELNSSVLVSWAVVCYHSSSLWILCFRSISQFLNELEEPYFHLTLINYHYDYKGKILLFLFSICRKWILQLRFQDQFHSWK